VNHHNINPKSVFGKYKGEIIFISCNETCSRHDIAEILLITR